MEWIVEPLTGFKDLIPVLNVDCAGALNQCSCSKGLMVCDCTKGLQVGVE
jgi:hypothetical protein